MRVLFTLLLGYTAYRMAVRIRDENSSRLLLTGQRPEAPRAMRPLRKPRSRAAASRAPASRASASRQRKRR
jgi:hypothetical protein